MIDPTEENKAHPNVLPVKNSPIPHKIVKKDPIGKPVTTQKLGSVILRDYLIKERIINKKTFLLLLLHLQLTCKIRRPNNHVVAPIVKDANGIGKANLL